MGLPPAQHPPPDNIWAHLQRQLSLSASWVLKLVPCRTRPLWRPAEPLYPLRESLETTGGGGGRGPTVRLGPIEEGAPIWLFWVGEPRPGVLGPSPLLDCPVCPLPLRDQAPMVCQASLVSLNLSLTQEQA